MIRRRRRSTSITTVAGPTTPSLTVPAANASPLAAVTSFVLPSPLLEATLEVLRKAGCRGCEAFVVWGATIDDGVVRFATMLVPDQVAYQTDDGLLITVDGEALFQINKTLYERSEILAAQVHSHPTAAFHSETDDCYSLVTLTGALSLVVPDFGRDGLDGSHRWAWYRLVGEGQWSPLTSADRVTLVGTKP